MSNPYGLLTPEFFRNPYPAYARLRADEPVHHYPELGAWLLSRYDDVDALLRDRRMSAERVGPLLPRADAGLADEVALLGRFFGDWMVFADAPDHTRLRAPMTRTFSARNIAALEPFITERAGRLIEDALEMGEFDLIEDMAMPLPLAVIGHVLGVRPADLPDFKQWSMELMAVPAMSGEPEARMRTATAAVRNMEALFTELIAERRSRPTDDLLSVLVNTGADGRPLTDEELVSTCALILAAGHETTANVIGNGMIALLTHPDQLAALRADPDLLAPAVEESMRYDSQSGWVGRITTEEVEFGGVPIPAGGLVFGLIGSANRDERVFTDADRFDIKRPAVRHLTFGHGLHVCLGAALARLEARICMGLLVRRMPDLRLLADEFEWIEGIALRGVVHLPVAAR
ncbi:cytochrome P450 [Streptomyces sp. NPDC059761]|uniref:cytochrome P450 n=1 Tax=Streptomyces sp. NPDC059761 TaxID=3346937 RepID=UPI003656A6BF